MKNKPGVIILPVLAVFVIFIILLFLLVGQKQTNNAILLEFRASKIINIMLDFYIQEDIPDPAELDENILGFGIYDQEGKAVYQYGSAPPALNTSRLRDNEITINKNRSIEIIRSVDNLQDEAASRLPPMMQRQFQELRDKGRMDQRMMPMLRKYQTGVYLEYRNSTFFTERRLIILIVVLFAASFIFLSGLIFSLYSSNRKLTIKSEHEKQLIQLGEAARTLAHEIRNPLSTLKIQRDLLRKKLPEGYEGNLDTIDRELKRLNTLVERVGEFLRNPVGSRGLIELTTYLSRLYGDRPEVLLPDVSPGTEICFDSERLRTVFDNVINNALEAAGEAEVSVSAAAGFTVVKIADRGPGIPEGVLERIFDPFFTTKNRGTGLGLSVVKQLMEASGGWVRIDNRNPGTCVSLGFRKTDGEVCENSGS